MGNQDVFNPIGVKDADYDIKTDANNNIYIAVNKSSLSVYKYNRSSNHWDNLGARGFVHTLYSTVSIGISDDQKTLYVATLNRYTYSNRAVDLYSYKINQ